MPSRESSTTQSQRGNDLNQIVPTNKTYRMLEWEDQYPPSAHLDVDWAAAMEATRRTGVQSVMVYAKDEWGWAYYSTKIGFRHPHLEGDLFGKEIELARRNRLSVVGYYALGWDNEAGIKHPSWIWRDQQGQQQPMGYKWYIPCLDSPYRQFVLGMLHEIFSNYEIDELWLDDYGIPFIRFYYTGSNPLCFCGYTEEAWNREHPDDPYQAGMNSRDGWVARYHWHEKRVMIDFLNEVIALRDKLRPQCLIEVNNSPEVLPDEIQKKVGFVFSETHVTPTGIALESILIRGFGRPGYQAGFYTSYGYMDTYPGNLGRVKADTRIVQNARVFLIGDAPLIPYLDGQGFSKRYMGVAKETFEDVRKVDDLLEGIMEPVYSTAMLYSELSTRRELAAQKRPYEFIASVEGALEALTYAGRSVESVPEFRLTPEFLNQFETLVLPEVEVLTEAQTGMIRNWVEGGGTLIASGRCGLVDERGQPRSNFPLADVLGVDYVSEEKKYAYDSEGKFKKGFIGIYLRSTGHPLASLIAESTVGANGAFLYLKKTSAEGVMDYVLPFMVLHPKDHLFYSEAAPPPGKESGGPAVTYNKFGKGQAVYIGIPIFHNVSMRLHVPEMIQDRLIWVRKWIPDLLRRLVPRPIAELTTEPASEYVHGSFFWENGKRSILVQVVNTVELATNGELLGSPRTTAWINPEKIKVKSARVLYPSEKELTVGRRDGRTQIVLPKFERYMVVRLRLA